MVPDGRSDNGLGAVRVGIAFLAQVIGISPFRGGFYLRTYTLSLMRE